MRRIDELHLEHPFAGAGCCATCWPRRRRGRPPACRDADEAHGHRGDLSPAEHVEARAGPQDLSVSAARPDGRAAEPGLGDGHHLHPDGARLRLSRRRRRLVQPAGAGASGVDHDGGRLLRRGAGGGAGQTRQAGDLQHRSGQPVHRDGLHRRPREERDRHQHGRQGRLARQRLRRAAVEIGQVRGGLPPGLRHRRRGARLDRPISRLLQSSTPAFEP